MQGPHRQQGQQQAHVRVPAPAPRVLGEASSPGKGAQQEGHICGHLHRAHHQLRVRRASGLPAQIESCSSVVTQTQGLCRWLSSWLAGIPLQAPGFAT